MPPASLSERFGARVRALRTARGWSQARLAEAVGLSPNHVGVMERGEKAPTLDTVEAVARALDTTPALLVAEPEARGAAAWLAQLQALAIGVPAGDRPLVAALLATLVEHLAAREHGRAGRAALRIHERSER
jgi:transcriptional regulator with XRE-family HTH domain